MSKGRLTFYLVIYIAALMALRYAVGRTFPTLPGSATDLWFSSGLLLVVLSVLVTEKYFTRPLDVVVNSLTVLLVLQAIDRTQRFPLYDLAYSYAILIGVLALLGFVLVDENAPQESLRQRFAYALYRVTGFFGGARVMFSAMFAISLFEYILANVQNAQVVSSQEWVILGMLVFWTSSILIEPIDRLLISPLVSRIRQPAAQRIGHVIRRFEPNLVMIAKSHSADTPAFGSFALIRSDTRSSDQGRVAMYLDDVDTDDGRFLQFYVLGGSDTGTPGTDVIPLDADRAQTLLAGNEQALATYTRRNVIVGTIAARSDIDVLRIRMIDDADRRLKLTEGDLLSVELYGKQIKYQVIGVSTDTEMTSGTNKAGTKFISAQQIGEWDATRQTFVNASWVPDVNALVFQETPDATAVPSLGAHCFSRLLKK